MQAMLRADVDASIAQDAFRAVVDRMDMAVEASLRLFARITRSERGLDFRDSGAAREWNQRDIATLLFVAVGHPVSVSRQFLDCDVHPRLAERLAAQVRVDAARGDLAVLCAGDQQRRWKGRIAAREYACDAGLET